VTTENEAWSEMRALIGALADRPRPIPRKVFDAAWARYCQLVLEHPSVRRLFEPFAALERSVEGGKLRTLWWLAP